MIQIKCRPEDFVVQEVIDLQFSGAGEHLWCYVEKRGMNTAFVARRLAKFLGCALREVSYSGLKDRRALTRQWFSVPARYAALLPEGEVLGDEFWRVLRREVHTKKLRIATHRKNAFTILLRGVGLARKGLLEERLAHFSRASFPNFFAEQRFGHDNLAWALSWVERGVLPKKREERSRAISVLRSEGFNRELRCRLDLGLWQALLSGDRLMLRGSHSHFLMEVLDDGLITRFKEGDVSPCGALFGAGDLDLNSEAGFVRAKAYASFQSVLIFLAKHAQLDWRPLHAYAFDLMWEWLGEDLCLSFNLARGTYATAFLAALLEGEDFEVCDG